MPLRADVSSLEAIAALVDAYRRVEPFNDEQIYSWFVRVCSRRHISPHDLRVACFDRREIWNIDVDTALANSDLLRVAEFGDVDISGLVSSLESGEYPLTGRKKAVDVVLRVGLYHRCRTLHGQQFCPSCLAADPYPYLRRSWRLATNVACDIHSSGLLDACPRCRAIVTPHRAFGCHIRRCCACGGDIADWGAQPPCRRDLLQYARAHGAMQSNPLKRKDLEQWEAFAKSAWSLIARRRVYEQFVVAFRPYGSDQWDQDALSAPIYLSRTDERSKVLPSLWRLYSKGRDAVGDVLNQVFTSNALVREVVGDSPAPIVSDYLLTTLPEPAKRQRKQRKPQVVIKTPIRQLRSAISAAEMLRLRQPN